MIELGDNQKKTIANGLTMFSLALVFAFIAFVAWGALKALSYVSSAIVPVVLGFFLSLFFKPYYRWWVKIVRNPTLALVVMLATIFIPLGIFVWYAGSVMIDQISNLIAQGPQLVAKVTEWFRATFPKARMLLDNLGVPYEDVAKLYTNYGGAAAKGRWRARGDPACAVLGHPESGLGKKHTDMYVCKIRRTRLPGPGQKQNKQY